MIKSWKWSIKIIKEGFFHNLNKTAVINLKRSFTVWQYMHNCTWKEKKNCLTYCPAILPILLRKGSTCVLFLCDRPSSGFHKFSLPSFTGSLKWTWQIIQSPLTLKLFTWCLKFLNTYKLAALVPDAIKSALQKFHIKLNTILNGEKVTNKI